MIRVDASAWPREYAPRWIGRLPSPYGHDKYITVAELARMYPDRAEHRVRSVDMTKVFFESFKCCFRADNGLIYYFRDWRQLNYTVPEYRQNRY